MYPELDAFYGLIVGVLIIWLSIERIHPEGYKFFGIFLIFSVVLGFIFPLLGALGFLLTVFVLWFFILWWMLVFAWFIYGAKKIFQSSN